MNIKNMKINLQLAHSIPLYENIHIDVRCSNGVQLILIKNDSINWAYTRGDKDRLLEQCNFNTDLLLFATSAPYNSAVVYCIKKEDLKSLGFHNYD